MHPAYSVILFTTASGAGLGFLAWLALFALLGPLPIERWLGFTGLASAFVLVAGGLLSSTMHLGRPERAWRALSQWRTSWLSREGVMVIATAGAGLVLAVGWLYLERVDGVFAVAAALAVVCAIVTLYATGMIYASLRTIRQWHQALTAPIYVTLRSSGAVLLLTLLALLREASPWSAWLAILLLSIGAALKWGCWLRIDGELRAYTLEAATGLGHLGKVRVLDPPHTQPNFVMREMGYRVARKHAQKLRKAVLLFASSSRSSFSSSLRRQGWPSRVRCLPRYRWPRGSSSSAGCSLPRPNSCPFMGKPASRPRACGCLNPTQHRRTRAKTRRRFATKLCLRISDQQSPDGAAPRATRRCGPASDRGG